MKTRTAVVTGDITIDWMLEFNLSQFERPSDLFEAFHQVRDVNLRGKIPLAVWDEFDTAMDGPLGWLRYFLEPMQDGEFQQGEITHPIGQCIFVFAGGTADRMAGFPNKEITEAQARTAKVRDKVEIDHGVLHAFLNAKKYNHGIRLDALHHLDESLGRRQDLRGVQPSAEGAVGAACER